MTIISDLLINGNFNVNFSVKIMTISMSMSILPMLSSQFQWFVNQCQLKLININGNVNISKISLSIVNGNINASKMSMSMPQAILLLKSVVRGGSFKK